MFLLGKKKILHRRDKTLKLVLLPRLYCFDTQPANMRRPARLSHVNADGAEPKMFENQDDHIVILSMGYQLDIQLCLSDLHIYRIMLSARIERSIHWEM